MFLKIHKTFKHCQTNLYNIGIKLSIQYYMILDKRSHSIVIKLCKIFYIENEHKHTFRPYMYMYTLIHGDINNPPVKTCRLLLSSAYVLR